MEPKRQFQHVAFLHQPENDCTEQPTLIQRAVQPQKNTLFPENFPVTPVPMPPPTIQVYQEEVDDQKFTPFPAHGNLADEEETLTEFPSTPLYKKPLWRWAVLGGSLIIVVLLIFIWHVTTPDSTVQTIAQQNVTNVSATPQATNGVIETPSVSDDGETIQVYILGAVAHPGVYILPSESRVYQLVEKAGGTLPEANTVALNLAAKLIDGEEIYVLTRGEALPANINNPAPTVLPGATSTTGQSVNINTATATEMEQILHVSSTTANKIIDYRNQHGPYTAITQLLDVISQSIYDRIKNMITV